MRLITISNLYPRPDQPTRGVFNFQLFREVGRCLKSQASETRSRAGVANPGDSGSSTGADTLLNICFVPEWRMWRWPAIRKWDAPTNISQGSGGSCRANGENSFGSDAVQTCYLPVFYLPLIGRSVNWWFYYRALRELSGQSVLAPVGSTVFLASWLFPDAVAVFRFAQDMGVPVFLRVHGTDRYHLQNQFRRRLILKAANYALGVLCNCDAIARELKNAGIPESKIHIIPNGVDTSQFHYRSREDAWALLERGQKIGAETRMPEAGSPCVLFVGNLVPIKGPEIMIKAFACFVKEKMPASAMRPQLLLIGSGPERDRLERLTRDLEVADDVQFLGTRPHGEVALWMNIADVLCLTSHSEGMPNVLLEGVASGLPVVATDVGGCRELLAGNPAARLCQKGDIVGIAEAVRELLGHKAMANKPPEQASWNNPAQRLIQVIHECVSHN